jgi:hypothetical protein
MEISDSQFETLVAMLADNRAAIINLDIKVSTELQEIRQDLQRGFRLLGAQLTVLEEDLGKVQTEQRSHGKVLAEHTQALEGITQLCKSQWDVTESIRRHQHGEELQSAHHGAHDESALT